MHNIEYTIKPIRKQQSYGEFSELPGFVDRQCLCLASVCGPPPPVPRLFLCEPLQIANFAIAFYLFIYYGGIRTLLLGHPQGGHRNRWSYYVRLNSRLAVLGYTRTQYSMRSGFASRLTAINAAITLQTHPTLLWMAVRLPNPVMRAMH